MTRHGIGQKTSHLYQVDNVPQLPGAGYCFARLSILCDVRDGISRGEGTPRFDVEYEQSN